MLYFGDNVPYSYRSGYRQFQCSPYSSKYDLPPSCAYGTNMGPASDATGYFSPGFGGYPFQQMSSSCMGFFQRRPGRIKGEWSMWLIFAFIVACTTKDSNNMLLVCVNENIPPRTKNLSSHIASFLTFSLCICIVVRWRCNLKYYIVVIWTGKAYFHHVFFLSQWCLISFSVLEASEILQIHGLKLFVDHMYKFSSTVLQTKL